VIQKYKGIKTQKVRDDRDRHPLLKNSLQFDERTMKKPKKSQKYHKHYKN